MFSFYWMSSEKVLYSHLDFKCGTLHEGAVVFFQDVGCLQL